jgi:hypothetical protein
MSRLRNGVHRTLEEEATRLITESLKGVTSHAEKRDVLTPWKEQDRRRRELPLSAVGAPDASMRRGMFHRTASTAPHLNSRDGIVDPQRIPRYTYRISAGHQGDKEDFFL